MAFLLKAPLLFHLIIMLLSIGCMVIHHVDSQTTGSSKGRCIVSERWALLEFKSGLVLDTKCNLSDWSNENVDCCRWEGVRCGKAGQVVSIDLRGPWSYGCEGTLSRSECKSRGRIKGEISPSLLQLSSLNYLDVSNNGFTKVPEFVGSLKRLRYLNFSNNPLIGKVPHQLGNLSVLESFDLNMEYVSFESYYEYNSRIQVDSFSWVAGLTSLKYLDMSNIRMVGAKDWLQSIFELPSLTSLYLRDSDLPFPAPTKMNSSTSLEVVDLINLDNLNIMALSPLLKASPKLVDLTISASGQLPSPFPDYLTKLVSIKYLNLSRNQLEGAIPETFKNLSNLITLDLSYNDIEGVIPETFSDLTNLKTLELSSNDLEGVIPVTFSNLTNLKTLDVSRNRLNKNYGFLESGSNSLQELIVNDNKLQGTLPNLSKFPNMRVLNLANNEFKGGLAQLHQSSNLMKLDVSSNHFSGTLTEDLFLNLTNLEDLRLSLNSLSLNFSSGFTPPFQLRILRLRSCKLGKIFPHWSRTQQNLTNLDISDSGISGRFPSWFWNISSRLKFLNVSHNSIRGSLPQNSLSSCEFVDLSSNRIHGTLPSFSKALRFLDVSNNAFSGRITFLCGLKDWSLAYLDLSHNFLSGSLPNCLGSFGESIMFLNLGNNNFTGSLPNSIGNLSGLMSLRLRNNNFFGNLPQSLEKCSSLIVLDLGENQFTGTIPEWIGNFPRYFAALRLRSNKFEGNIPSSLCRLDYIQILDLSFNNISGTIPSCLGNFTIMSNTDITPHFGFIIISEDGGERVPKFIFDGFSAQVFWKGIQIEYKNAKGIQIFKYMDLSNNILSGLIPEELTTLAWLGVLSLSHNFLVGPIPNNIGQMRMLEVLDLSHNLLLGEIPLSITDLSTLSYLDLSYNNLTGSVPVSTQLSTFDPAMFEGNAGLCGAPLPNLCRRGGNVGTDVPNTREGDDNEKMGVYISICLGFIVGFWGVCGILLINKSLARWYFQSLTHIKERLHVAFLIGLANLRRRFANAS